MNYSTIMKDEIKKILQDYMLTDMPLNDATQQVLDLFAIMQRSEQWPCERCKKLEFMIENGLGWKDMENDCT